MPTYRLVAMWKAIEELKEEAEEAIRVSVIGSSNYERGQGVLHAMSVIEKAIEEAEA